MPSKALACTVAICLLLTSTGLVIAQSNTGCDATNCTGPRGEWHANRENVVQSAEVAASNRAVGIGIQIQNQDQVPQTSADGPGRIIQEQPKGPQHFSDPGISVPGWSNPGRSPDPILPLDGSNIIVPGGPMSAETSLGQPPTLGGQHRRARSQRAG